MRGDWLSPELDCGQGRVLSLADPCTKGRGKGLRGRGLDSNPTRRSEGVVKEVGGVIQSMPLLARKGPGVSPPAGKGMGKGRFIP